MKKTISTLIVLAIFSMAMGFLETAVVVYLRKLYYEGGFHFPMVSMGETISRTETIRELATLIMLFAIGYVAGRNFVTRLAGFLFCFAVWDISYYVFLKMLLGWPDSLLSWDILFLIPVPWAGPVISPVVVSMTLIFFSVSVFLLHEKGYEVKIDPVESAILITGCSIIFISFILDYLQQWSFAINVHVARANYSPLKFNWFVFIMGEIILLSGISNYIYKRIYRLRTDRIQLRITN